MEIDTLIHARWIIPMAPDATVYEQHALAIHAGKIEAIVPSAEAAQFQAFDEYYLEQHALLPGLINAHTHAAMHLFRGLADDLPLQEWLHGHIWPAEKRWIDAEFVACGSRLAIAEMIRTGTTCFNDMYFFPDTTAEVASAAGIRALLGLIIIDFPSAWAQGSDMYFSKGIAVHDKFKHNQLIQTAFAPHAPYTVADADLQRLSLLAGELDIPIHMHLHETADEVQQGQQRYGKSPLLHLQDLGLLGPSLIAVHMTQLEPDEIALLARYGVNVVHCPESNLKLASGFCPLPSLLAAGVNVAIGTDSAASNNDLDMFSEMRTAALLAKGLAKDSSAVSAYNALCMGTSHAAAALGISDIVGSLTPGKLADVIAVDLGGCTTQPVYDPISQIVYAGNGQLVSDVWIHGVQRLAHHDLTTMAVAPLLDEVRRWQELIAASDTLPG